MATNKNKNKTGKAKFNFKDWLKSRLLVNAPIAKYVAGFISLIILFYIIYSSAFFEDYIVPPLVSFQTKIASGILNILGHETTGANGLLTGPNVSLDVAKGCDGLEPLAFFIIGLILVPFSFRYKMVGLSWGILILFILNLIRIVGLYFSKIYFPSAFDFLHLHGGFALFTVITMLVWAAWAQWAINQKKISPSNASI